MKKTTLPTRSRSSSVRKNRPTRLTKKTAAPVNNVLGVVALLVVLVGVAVALALSGKSQDTRQQAAFQITQPTPDTFCGLRVTDNFSRKYFTYRWARSGSNFAKKNAVKRAGGVLRLDTLGAKDEARTSGVFQLKATDGQFTARTTLRRLQFGNKKQVAEKDEVPGYFALEQYHYISPTNNGYNSLRILTQPDGAYEAALVSIKDGQIIEEAKGSKWIPGNVRNLRLELKRKNGKLFGRVYNKAGEVDLLLGPITPWDGSGSLAMHVYANPQNRVMATVDNYASNFCVKSCQGAAQAENFEGDINDNWYVNGVSNDDISNNQLKLQILPEQGSYALDFLKSKAVSRATQTSVLSIDLTQTKLPQRSQVRFMLTNEPETKYAALIIQPNKKGKLVIRNAFYEYGKLKISKVSRAVIPANTQKLRLRISRNDKKVKVSYKLDNQNWQQLSRYTYYLGPTRTKVELRNTANKPLRQAAILTLNTIRIGCFGSGPTPEPIVLPTPAPEDRNITENPGELEDPIIGTDPIEIDPIEDGGKEEYEEENPEDDWDDDDWGWEDDDEEWIEEVDDTDFGDEA